MNLNGQHPTPPELVPYERAARIYCERFRLDPDEQIPAPHPMGLHLPYAVPFWWQIAERMIDLSALLSAMKASKDEAAAPKIVVPS